MRVTIQDIEFILDHRKVLFDVEKKRLILADLHIGKSAHFRKSGHSLPSYGLDSDLKRFQEILEEYQPNEVLILGDLFHSDHNEEFLKWNHILKKHSKINFILVVGNHDRWSLNKNRDQKMELISELDEQGVLYTHEPIDKGNKINFCGHLHPGVLLLGEGRQRIKLSCFWLSKTQLILPAFSELTGLHIIKPTIEDRVFTTIDDKVIELL